MARLATIRATNVDITWTCTWLGTSSLNYKNGYTHHTGDREGALPRIGKKRRPRLPACLQRGESSARGGGVPANLTDIQSLLEKEEDIMMAMAGVLPLPLLLCLQPS